MYDAKNDFLV